MSYSATKKCDQCGKVVDVDIAYGRWYELKTSRAYSSAIDTKGNRVDMSFDACSLACAGPLFVKLFESVADDAARLAKKESDEDAKKAVEAARVEGLRLLGAAMSELLGGGAS